MTRSSRTSWLLLLHPAFIAAAAAVALTWIGIEAIATTHEGYAGAQTRWLALSLIAMTVCALPNARLIGLAAFPALLAVLALLLLLVIPFIPASIVPVRNGIRAWINLRFMMFQPSEVAKIVFVLALARYLRHKKNYRQLRGLLKPFFIMFVPVLLILKQPDLGTAIVFPLALYVMLVAAGAKLKHLGAIAALAALAVGLNIAAIYLLPDSLQPLRPHQRDRIIAMIDQVNGNDAHIQDKGFQQHKAMTLIGSGRATGYGDRATDIVRLNKLPEDHNDMIFAVIANRWGLRGCAVTLGLFAVIIACFLLTAAQSKDPFARLCIVGFAGLLFFQTAINIGMNIGVLPIIGITLPFVSYGGSSLIATFLMIGLVINLGLQRPTIITRPSFEYTYDQPLSHRALRHV